MITIVKIVAIICPFIMALVYFIRAKICEESFFSYIPELTAYIIWDALVYIVYSKFMIYLGAA